MSVLTGRSGVFQQLAEPEGRTTSRCISRSAASRSGVASCSRPLLSANVRQTRASPRSRDNMGNLSKFLVGVPGYFRDGEEEHFPWTATGATVWYALFVVENGKLEKYGFTSSKSGKKALVSALQALSQDDESLLIGVWNGQYRTDLFILQAEKALSHLQVVS